MPEVLDDVTLCATVVEVYEESITVEFVGDKGICVVVDLPREVYATALVDAADKPEGGRMSIGGRVFEDMYEDADVLVGDGGDLIGVAAYWEPGEPAPVRLNVRDGETETEAYLTPKEAREIAEWLLEAAHRVEMRVAAQDNNQPGGADA